MFRYTLETIIMPLSIFIEARSAQVRLWYPLSLSSLHLHLRVPVDPSVVPSFSSLKHDGTQVCLTIGTVTMKCLSHFPATSASNVFPRTFQIPRYKNTCYALVQYHGYLSLLSTSRHIRRCIRCGTRRMRQETFYPATSPSQTHTHATYAEFYWVRLCW